MVGLAERDSHQKPLGLLLVRRDTKYSSVSEQCKLALAGAKAYEMAVDFL